MPIEYEYNFTKFDKNDVIKKIKKLGGTHKGKFLFRVYNFKMPNGQSFRVRDEGYKVTMTYKNKNGEFADEYEIIVTDFDEAVKLLIKLGYEKKYYYEKIRDIWLIKNTEIDFNIVPGIPEYLEIECTTKKDLDEMIEYFELEIEKKSDTHLELFGIDFEKKVIPKIGYIDLAFDNIKLLLPYVTKNKKQFEKLVVDQMKMYKKYKK